MLKLQYFGHLMQRASSLGKDPDAGKNWRRKEKGTTENEMVGWHHWLNGHECELMQGNSEGQGSLACCSPWGRKELDRTEWLNNSNSYAKKVWQCFLRICQFATNHVTNFPFDCAFWIICSQEFREFWIWPVNIFMFFGLALDLG